MIFAALLVLLALPGYSYTFGILTQPYLETPQEYIAGSYVQYLESAGCTVRALSFSWNSTRLKFELGELDGILLPGGGADISLTSPLFRSMEIVLNEAKATNERRRFVVWGTCLGWEGMAQWAGGVGVLGDEFDGVGMAGPVRIVRESGRVVGRSFSGAGRRLIRAAEVENSFFFSHHMGVGLDNFKGKLEPIGWVMTASAKDGKGKEFVAGAELKGLPFFGVQFHPEKSLFEWKANVGIPKQRNALLWSQHFISFLTMELAKAEPVLKPGDERIYRKNIRRFKSKYMGDEYFMQLFLFEKGELHGEQLREVPGKLRSGVVYGDYDVIKS